MDCPNCKKYTPDTNYKCPHCGTILKDGLDPADFRPMRAKQKSSFTLTHFLLIVIVVGIGVVGYFFFQKEFAGEKAGSAGAQVSPPPAQETRGVVPDAGNEEETGGFNGREQQEQQTEQAGGIDTGETEEQDTAEPEEAEDPYAWVKKRENRRPVISYRPGEEVDIERMLARNKITIFDFYSRYCGPCVKISPLLERLDRKRNDLVVVKIDINRPGVRGIDWKSPVIKQYGIRSIPYFIIYDDGGSRTHEGRAASGEVYQLLSREGIR
ncbi:MAG: thioredoxin family protein [bacterium]|nr:thioredoxin family protein [bacterium]